MDKVVLGTVQLGLPYGINNKYGKPSKDEVYEILSYAFDKGIRILDTASNYGDSEQRIGDFMKDTKKVFEVSTKLPKIVDYEEVQEFVDMHIYQSLNRLNVDVIKYYFLHSFYDVKTIPNILSILNEYKLRNIIKNIGVSIYEPYELEYIMENLMEYITVVQIPFNILDNRWLENDLLIRAKNKGLTIFSRSMYLQGLFFAEEDIVRNIHNDAMRYIDLVKDIAVSKGVKIQQILIDYVKMQSSIDYFLIGCEKIEQLKENIKFIDNDCRILNEDVKKIIDNSKYIPKEIIDPREWD